MFTGGGSEAPSGGTYATYEAHRGCSGQCGVGGSSSSTGGPGAQPGGPVLDVTLDLFLRLEPFSRTKSGEEVAGRETSGEGGGGGEGGAWLALKSPSQPPGQGGRLGAALFLLGDSLDLSPSALPPPSPSPEQGSANSSWEGRAARMPLELLYFLSIIARGDRRGTHHPAPQRRAPGRARGVVLLQVQLGGQPARGGSR